MKVVLISAILISLNVMASDYSCQSKLGKNSSAIRNENWTRVPDGEQLETTVINRDYRVTYNLTKNSDYSLENIVTVQATVAKNDPETRTVLAQVVVSGKEGTDLSVGTLIPKYNMHYWVNCRPETQPE